MDNIEDILRALAEDTTEQNSGTPESSDAEAGSGGEGLFSGLDFDTIAKAAALMGAVNSPSDDEKFLLALRPLLREENRPKVDTAVKLLKLASLLPLLKDMGLFGK